MSFWIRSLGQRPGQVADLTWGWADHDGWHEEEELPRWVPTGDLWGWGDDQWIYWRDDVVGGVGAELVMAQGSPGSEWIMAEVVDHDGPQLPMVVTELHQLATEPAVLADGLRGRPRRVLDVHAPTQLAFLGA